MYLIRNVFQAEPGMVKELVKIWKAVIPIAEKHGYKGNRILTDVASDFWTFIYEYEIESLADFEKGESFTSDPEVRKLMDGYMDMVSGGYREIFKIV